MDISKSFRVGDWRVEPSRHILTGPDGEEIRLAPKTIDVLCLLASRHGIVVSRDDILEQVWHTSGAGDDSLNNAISSLRATFGDDRKNPLYIETIPKRGYRLAASVRATDSNGATGESDGRATARPALWLAAGLSAASILAVSIIIFTARGPTFDTYNFTSQPLTSLPGVERDAQISPDDRQIAFAHTGHIYTSPVRASKPKQLTNSDQHDAAPVWSPDGDEIAFIRYGEKSCTVFVRTLASTKLRSITDCTHDTFPALAWHPSGRWLALAERSSITGLQNLTFVDVQTGARSVQPIQTENATGSNFIYFRFSPDGSKIAFVHNQLGGDQVMHAALQFKIESSENPYAVEGIFPSVSAPQTIPLAAERINGIDWLGDKHLVASVATQYRAAIWKYRLGDVHAEKLMLPSSNPVFPVASRKGKFIAYSDAQFDMDVWIATSINQSDFTHSKLIDSTKLDIFASFSPDGKEIAFVSSRTGQPEIWVADSAGSNLRQLTYFSSDVTNPVWSPDQQAIATSVSDDNQFDVWRISLDTTRKRMSNTPANEIVTDWRGDNEALLYFVDSAEGLTTKQIKISTLTSTALHPNGGIHAHYGGGAHIYFVKSNSHGIWSYNPESNSSSLAIDDLNPFDPLAWSLGEAGLYYIDRQANGDALIKFMAYSNSVLSDIAVIEGAAPFHHMSLNVFETTNQVKFLYSKTDVLEADIMIAEISG